MRFDGEVPPEADWLEPLAGFVAAAVRAAGGCLDGAGRGCSVSVSAVCKHDGREHTVSYRGKAEREPLVILFDEIDKLPAFRVSSGTVNLELWFRVNG